MGVYTDDDLILFRIDAQAMEDGRTIDANQGLMWVMNGWATQTSFGPVSFSLTKQGRNVLAG